MNSLGSLDESVLRRQRLPYKWLALITASVGLLLASLNGGIVNVALPTIASEFAPPLTQVQWVLAIYPLMTVGLMLPPNTSAAMGAAESSRLGSVSALYMTVRQLGTALGVALSGAVFSSRMVAYSGTGVVFVRGGLFDPAASAAAFRDVFWVLAIVAALGVLTSLLQPANGWGSR